MPPTPTQPQTPARTRTQAPLLLGDYLSAPTRGPISSTPYGSIDTHDLADFLARRPGLHRQALTAAGEAGLIHPTAFVHRPAIVREDVIIGAGAKVFESSTVRKGSVVCAGASIGFNCEVTAAFIGEDAVLGHHISVNRTIVGAGAHLSAGVTVAAINLCDGTNAITTEEQAIADRLRAAGGVLEDA